MCAPPRTIKQVIVILILIGCVKFCLSELYVLVTAIRCYFYFINQPFPVAKCETHSINIKFFPRVPTLIGNASSYYSNQMLFIFHKPAISGNKNAPLSETQNINIIFSDTNRKYIFLLQ